MFTFGECVRLECLFLESGQFGELLCWDSGFLKGGYCKTKHFRVDVTGICICRDWFVGVLRLGIFGEWLCLDSLFLQSWYIGIEWFGEWVLFDCFFYKSELLSIQQVWSYGTGYQ